MCKRISKLRTFRKFSSKKLQRARMILYSVLNNIWCVKYYTKLRQLVTNVYKFIHPSIETITVLSIPAQTLRRRLKSNSRRDENFRTSSTISRFPVASIHADIPRHSAIVLLHSIRSRRAFFIKSLSLS